MKRAIWLGSALFILAGCGGDKDLADSGAATGTATTPSTSAPATGDTESEETDDTETGGPISHAADIQPIWDTRCTPCHIGAESGGLSLEDGYAAAVDVPSGQAGDVDLVEPGSTADSYLWHKLEGTQADVGGSGDAMPLGGPLEPDELDLIEAWINEGCAP